MLIMYPDPLVMETPEEKINYKSLAGKNPFADAGDHGQPNEAHKFFVTLEAANTARQRPVFLRK